MSLASQFSPYAPPPDAHVANPAVRPWFPPASDTSYQSGGIPNWNTSASGGQAAAELAEGSTNQWETRYGARVDVLAALAYLLGPISALLLLMFETANDYVRFHAYQSSMLTTPLVFIRIFASIAHFPKALRTILTLLLLCSQIGMACRSYYDAIRNDLFRYHLPYIGRLAERWVLEE